MRRPLSLPLLALALFAFIYNISFIVAPSLTTGRLVLLLLLPFYWRGLQHVAGGLGPVQRAAIPVLALIVVYSCAQYVLVSGGDAQQLSRLLNFGFFVLIGGPVFAAACGYSAARFATGFAAAATLQSGLIVISFLSRGYREWLAARLVQGGNIPLTSALQAPGFSNSSGATLSLLQALGVFAALLAARLSSGRQRVVLLLCALACLLSTVVVGRTGLQLAVVFVAFFVVTMAPGRLVGTAAIVMAVAGVFVLLRDRLEARLAVVAPGFSGVLAWAFEFFASGLRGSFFREFGSQPLPPVDLAFLVGTGRVSAPNGTNASGHDSGYVQTAFALGIPMAFVFYAAMAAATGEALKAARQIRVPLAVLILSMFLVEIKEPFMFKYMFPFLALALLWMAGDLQAHTQETRLPTHD